MKTPMNIPSLSRRTLMLGVGGVTLAGCTLPDLKDIVGPPVLLQIYVLAPQRPAQAAAGAAVRWQLGVALPESTAGLDTTRIAVFPSASTMDYFSNAAWADRAPVLIQGLLVQALEDTRRVAVARDTAGVATEYVLQTELRDFQAFYDSPLPPPPLDPEAPLAPRPPPIIIVQIEAKLMSIPDRRIVGSFNAMTHATAVTNSVDGAVAAFNQARGQAHTQIVDWTLRTPPNA